MFCDGSFGVIAVRCQLFCARVAVIRDGCFSVVAVSCQLLVVRFAMFRDGCILVIDRIGRRSVGQIDRIVVGGCRLVM